MVKADDYVDVSANPLLEAPREFFFIEVDSLLSWIAHRGWVITSDDDKERCKRLYLQARAIYEAKPIEVDYADL